MLVVAPDDAGPLLTSSGNDRWQNSGTWVLCRLTRTVTGTSNNMSDRGQGASDRVND